MSTVNGNAAEYVCLSVYISRHPTAPGHTTPSAQLLWPMGFLSGWPICLELPAGQLAGSGYWREQF